MSGNPEIDAIIKALPGSGNHQWNKHDSIKDSLYTIQGSGHWSPEVKDRVIEVGQRYSLLVAERYLENSASSYKDPRFDPEVYHQLFMQAQQRFGALAGGYFSRSYGRMLEADVDPRRYYELVDQAVERRGKKFASWFAYFAPEAVEFGVNPRQFLSLAGSMHIKGGLNLARAFLSYAPFLVKEFEQSLEETHDLAAECVEETTPKAASLMLTNIISAIRLGYPPDEFVLDGIRIQHQTGKDTGSAASWYYSAFNGLGQMSRQGNVFNPLDFKTQYPRVLFEINQTAATTYSLLARAGDGGAWGDVEEWSLEQLADGIFDLRAGVSPKLYRSALWYIPKIAQSPQQGLELMAQVMADAQIWPENIVIQALAYTRGIAKGASVESLHYPMPEQEAHIYEFGGEEENFLVDLFNTEQSVQFYNQHFLSEGEHLQTEKDGEELVIYETDEFGSLGFGSEFPE
jgi:hypothetical protein